MKKFFILLAILFIQACTPGFGGMTPILMDTDTPDAPGPPEYKAGWKDGCQSGFATYGTAINKLQFQFYQNYGMLKDAYYVAGWHEGFDFCRHYNLKWYTQDN